MALLIVLVGFSHENNVYATSEKQESLVKNQHKEPTILPLGTGTWNYNTRSSSFTLSNGSITVYSNPGTNTEPNDNYNFVIAEVIKEGDWTPYASKTLSGTKSETATFTNLTGTFYVKVYNYNYPLLPGSYTVLW